MKRIPFLFPRERKTGDGTKGRREPRGGGKKGKGGSGVERRRRGSLRSFPVLSLPSFLFFQRQWAQEEERRAKRRGESAGCFQGPHHLGNRAKPPFSRQRKGEGTGFGLRRRFFCPSPPLCFLHYLLCAKPFFSGGGGGRIIHNALSP